MNTAVIYVRVSSREQLEKGVSMEEQEARLRTYCELFDLEVVEVYRDGAVTSKVPLHRRPVGARMIKALKAGKAHHVVAKHLDRLFRNTEEALRWMREWEAHDRHVHLLDMHVDTTTASGWLIITVLAGVAQFERQRLSERVSDALQHKKRALQRYCKRVYGWSDTDGVMEPVAAEQQVIRRMRKLKASGKSLRAIAELLSKDGVTAPGGGSRWHQETVRRILNNDINREAEPAA